MKYRIETFGGPNKLIYRKNGLVEEEYDYETKEWVKTEDAREAFDPYVTHSGQIVDEEEVKKTIREWEERNK